MAWIELHQGLPYNKKTLRLKRILRIKTAQAVGHVCMLWLWALDNAQDGDLTRFSAGEIAEVSGWCGKRAEDFVAALQEAGFLDADRQIHDWHSYAGRLIEKRRADAERKRLMRERVREQAACPADVPAAGGAPAADSVRPARVTLPNPTEPYPTGHSAAAPGIAVGTALEERTGGADAPPASAGEAGSPGTASCDCRQPGAKPDGKAAASGGSREAGAPGPCGEGGICAATPAGAAGRLCETGDRAIGPAHAEKDGAAGEEGAIQRIEAAFSERIRPAKPGDKRVLAALCGQYPEESVLSAVEEGARSGGRSANYIAAILRRWETSSSARKPPARPGTTITYDLDAWQAFNRTVLEEYFDGKAALRLEAEAPEEEGQK